MGKKAPQSMFTGPLACEIDPPLIVGCNAIEMRDLDVGVAVIKVVPRPVRSGLSRRIPMRQVSMVDSVRICVTVTPGNGVTRPAVVPDSVRGNAIWIGFLLVLCLFQQISRVDISETVHFSKPCREAQYAALQ
jgi:hypothetical protein